MLPVTMRRRALLALSAALAAPPARAQPAVAGAEAMRAAGRQAVALANAQRWAEAEAAAQAADPLIRTYVAWLRLQQRGGASGAAEVVGFALGNPDWPGQETLGRRAEELLASDADDVLAAQWFAARAPRTLDGYQRLADALARAGKGAEATEVLRAGWAEAPADAGLEAAFLARNAGILAPAHHARRFDRLALARDGAGAARVLPYLEGPAQVAGAARLAYAADRPDADSPGLAALAPADPALTLERARWLRRRDRDQEAAAAFAAGERMTPLPAPDAARAAWPERQVLARKLLRLGDPRAAYAVCAHHGIAAPGEPRQEAEFLAGFIALRILRDAPAAERHFARLGEESRSVITRARSHYWQGRAAEAQGAGDRATKHYRAAAEFPLAFYGQLAAVALGEDGAALAARIAGTPAPHPSAAQQKAFEAREPARLVLALADIGEARRARPFLLRLEELGADPAEKLLAVRLARRIGRPDHAVWVARRAGASGLMAVQEGWPLAYPAPADAPEPALVLGISRQESNFDPEAVSSANARGLMQLLPSTAASVAKRLGLRHQVGMLTTDTAHNMRLGAAYLDELLARFGGTLPFAIAGYNAGPNRVDEWLGTYGDPRGGGLSMLDWMEQVPFAETRNYVQRVLENMAIYRALDARSAALEHPMTQWLRAAG
ncbi:lytic transglycosylase domain-containing protein [Paracraurococcus lichenis]|uniref:Lytic transglycosylase domain-containing protein n=1 Tax=Paracraurococcus lichenis TaxID=3064888 RepID=A0ABT9EAQ0_9PROT|nr:lytic transglycosylase domain-containing protein [Paracraurococcus sp. LOR1-02]MDO9712995.1 lytic transglycosylase domain-containing protein [Paracraurococcus sp. LOR1-02]